MVGKNNIKPNLILIVLDTLRADRICIDNDNKKLTPFIENLLQNSIYFENCIATSPFTLPSHIAMFTGLYPSQNVLLSNDIGKVSNRIPILTEILKELGYHTFCFTENPFINKGTRLSRGFEEIFKCGKSIRKLLSTNENIPHFSNFIIYFHALFTRKIKNKKLLKFLDNLRHKIESLFNKIVFNLFWKNLILESDNTFNDLDRFSQLLRNNLDKKPFYIYINSMANHSPYIPLKEALRYIGVTYKDIKYVKDFLLSPLKYYIKINLLSKPFSQKQINSIEKLYKACAFYNDLIVKKIFSILNNLDLIQNTYIIIISDHGEHLGGQLDHYLWEHGTLLSLYEPVIKVPLIIYNKCFKNRVFKNQVELKDLFHTILHLTGISHDRNKYVKLRKSLIFQNRYNITPKFIYGEYLKNNAKIVDVLKKYKRRIKKPLDPKLFLNLCFLRSNEFKYIKYLNNNAFFSNLANGKEEFYNLLNDKFEQLNIFDIENENVLKMQSYLKSFLEKIHDLKHVREIVTKKEKNLIKNKIRNIKI